MTAHFPAIVAHGQPITRHPDEMLPVYAEIVIAAIDDRDDCCPHCGLTPEGAQFIPHADRCPNAGVDPTPEDIRS